MLESLRKWNAVIWENGHLIARSEGYHDKNIVDIASYI